MKNLIPPKVILLSLSMLVGNTLSLALPAGAETETCLRAFDQSIALYKAAVRATSIEGAEVLDPARKNIFSSLVDANPRCASSAMAAGITGLLRSVMALDKHRLEWDGWPSDFQDANDELTTCAIKLRNAYGSKCAAAGVLNVGYYNTWMH